MAKYSMELWEIAENTPIFDFTYTFYTDDPQVKADFEQKFLNKFYFDEINFQTVFRFKHELARVLNERMSYYKQLYDTTLFVYDPIQNYDVTETINVVSQSINSGTGLNNQYDTPINPKTNYERTPSFINDTTQDSQTDNTGDTTRSMQGNIGVQTTQDMINKERDIIINIDELILNETEIQNLFCGLL